MVVATEHRHAKRSRLGSSFIFLGVRRRFIGTKWERCSDLPIRCLHHVPWRMHRPLQKPRQLRFLWQCLRTDGALPGWCVHFYRMLSRTRQLRRDLPLVRWRRYVRCLLVALPERPGLLSPAMLGRLLRGAHRLQSCGATCNLSCVAGHCTSNCPAGWQSCVAGCRDVANDRLHCGICGNACAPGESCAQGSCVPGAR
jgi:hypothetical protein